MSVITFKKYEQRPDPDPEVEVCECGHEEMRHHNSTLNFVHMLDSKLHNDSSKKRVVSPRIDSCETCMCEHFKKITTMKKSKYIKKAGWFN